MQITSIDITNLIYQICMKTTYLPGSPMSSGAPSPTAEIYLPFSQSQKITDIMNLIYQI